jgi:hypothetical protein
MRSTLAVLLWIVVSTWALAAENVPPLPLPIDFSRTAQQRWLAKPVLESRLLDDMENPATWKHFGPGRMLFTTERFKDGKQSLRITSRTISIGPDARSGRPFGEAVIHRGFPGEDWGGFNRISVWVYPTMNGHKNGSILLKLFNDGTEKHPQIPTRGPMHYALVKPGQWNHIVWEIAHLSRDKVTAIELIYRLQGNEPGASDIVSFDFDQLELQRVEPDYFEGWAVAPGHIAFSHSGYELDANKTALASRVTADRFSIVDAVTGKAVMEKAIARLSGELGEFAVMDFSDLKTPGFYAIVAGNVKTPPFRVAPNVWRDTVWKTINFFYCERCGCKIVGIHDVCHADWQAEHNGRHIVINGGWHDAGDLSQGLINTGEATHAMFTLAERIGRRDPVLTRRLIEEARWGLDWLHKTRFGDGSRVTWATMDYWTDGKIGTADDTFGGVGNSPADNAVGASASAIAARMLKPIEPALAAKSLQIAREDWQFAIDRLSDGNVETLGAVVLASVELFKTTGRQTYLDKAAELARALVDSQQRSYSDAIPLAGFFYSSPRKDQILNYFHRGHDQAAPVALARLCEVAPHHPDWMKWYSAVALHSEYQRQVSAFQSPYSILPAGVYRLSDRPDQVSKGKKLDDRYFLRRFPVWDGFRGHYGVLLSQTKSLTAAARLRNRADLFDLAQLQLQWVVGRNPFAQSTMYGEGYDYAPQYTAMSGDMVGSLPVGIQTKNYEDIPFWPVTNCWNYKEVWVHPSSRWLYIMADVMGEAPKKTVSIEISQQSVADGRITIAASAKGTGTHRLFLRGFNLKIDDPARTISLAADNRPQSLSFGAKVDSNNAPWLAVICVDDDATQCRDITSPPRALPLSTVGNSREAR